MTTQTLDDRELADLRALVGTIIPASDIYGVPGADDDKIFADIVKTAGPFFSMLSGALAGLDALAQEHGAKRFADLAPDACNEVGKAFQVKQPEVAGLLSAVTAQCYYRDDRVMRSLNMEPRPPFPLGFEVEEGDWSLLDPVRARPEFYRKAP